MITKKRAISILLAAFLLFAAIPMTAYAALPSAEAEADVEPPVTRFANISSITVTLTITSGTATCKGTIVGFAGTTKISATYTLQRKPAGGSYSDYKPWPPKTVYGPALTFSETQSVPSGYTYRLKCDAIVTRNGIDEKVTEYSPERAY